MEEYSTKITAEPFLYNETKIIASYLLEGYSKNELIKKNIDENLIKYKSPKSIIRVHSPIFRRLEILDDELLKDFVNTNIENSKYILLYAIMKTDKLVRDFIFEVYKDKLLMKSEYIEKFEIDNWYEEKCILSQSLKEKSETTTSKVKQVIMKILQDSGLVVKENNRFKIVRPLLKEEYIHKLEQNGDMQYAKAIGGLI